MFLEEKVTKYHRTLTTYLNTLLSNGFIINHIVEPQPPEYMMDIPGMQDEMRRPMMLIVSANKKVDRLAEVDNKNYLQLRNNVLV